jgi:hypothetical protein
LSLAQPGYAPVLFYDPTGIMALKLAIGVDLMTRFTIRRFGEFWGWIFEVSSIPISTAIFCLMGLAGMATYLAFYGGHRVFQERFAEMAIKMQIAEGDGKFPDGREPEGFARTLFQRALQRMPKPTSDKIINTLVRTGFIRSRALGPLQLIRVICPIVTGIVGLVVATWFGLTGGRVALVVLGSLALGYFAPTLLSAVTPGPAPEGYFQTALRRSRLTRCLRRSGSWFV